MKAVPFAFPVPDSQACHLLTQQDWSVSPLGLPHTWPDTLKVALGLILRSPESMYLAWGPKRLFFFNDAYGPILGPRLATAMGRPMAEVWFDVWDAVRDAVDRTFAGESFRYEDQSLTMCRHGRTEQTYWTYSFSPVCEPDGTVAGLFCVTREQTSRIATEQRHENINTALIAEVEKGRDDLARSEEQLRQSQKLEAVGQLTGGLAHDFNNMLAAIMGCLEMMQVRLAQGRISQLDHYVATGHAAAKRAAVLTHRLLAFSRRQTLDPKPTDINRLVLGIEGLIRRTAGLNVEIEIVTAGGVWISRVDPHQLENALINLCNNARDAMPHGGKLTIETANRWLDERGARERDILSGQYVSICVSDNGEGMPPDVARQAFDPFFTTKPIGEGTGLGLSMIYGFARQSGGQARIYSEVGKGTMVCLYLPRDHGTDDVVETDAAPVPMQPEVDERGVILLVDDEPAIRMLAAEVLDDIGYLVIEAADGAAALKVLQSSQHLELLITDVGLPNNFNGRQVADAGRTLRPDLKVLFITGYAENAVLHHGHLEAGMHMMMKPFALDAFVHRVKKIIAAHPIRGK